MGRIKKTKHRILIAIISLVVLILLGVLVTKILIYNFYDTYHAQRMYEYGYDEKVIAHYDKRFENYGEKYQNELTEVAKSLQNMVEGMSGEELVACQQEIRDSIFCTTKSEKIVFKKMRCELSFLNAEEVDFTFRKYGSYKWAYIYYSDDNPYRPETGRWIVRKGGNSAYCYVKITDNLYEYCDICTGF